MKKVFVMKKSLFNILWNNELYYGNKMPNILSLPIPMIPNYAKPWGANPPTNKKISLNNFENKLWRKYDKYFEQQMGIVNIVKILNIVYIC